MTGNSATRNLRRSSLAVVLVFLSVVAHTAAAGSLPALPGLLGVAVVSTALAFALGDRRRSFSWLVVYLATGQVLLHVVMTAMGHHSVSLLPDRGMALAHALAAVAAAAVFAKFESIAAAWTRATHRILGAPFSEIAAPPSRSIVICSSNAENRAHVRVNRGSHSWRGPPVRSLVAHVHS